MESIILRYPMGALVALKTTNAKGDARFAVIDGKQRVTAITEFYAGKFGLTPSQLRRMAAYGTTQELVKKAAISAKSEGPFYWNDMSNSFKERFDSYVIPVVELQGTVADAQQAFERMNSTVYRLVEQEIRNAVFSSYAVLESCRDLAERSWPGFNSNPLEAWGFIDKTALRRMRDVEFYSELLHLLHDGPQNVRRNLSLFYRSFSPDDHSAVQSVSVLSNRLTTIFRQLSEVFGVTDFQQWGFRGNPEDLYALVGAFYRAAINTPQMTRFHQDLRSTIASFMGLVDDVIDTLASGKTPTIEEADDKVLAYAGTYLKGQKNSDKRRRIREDILLAIISEVIGTKDPKRAFSEHERRKIWRASPDKKCVTCGKVVEWKDFEAGHAHDHGLSGPTVVENGILQCRRCNRASGAKLKSGTASGGEATRDASSGSGPADHSSQV